MTFDSEFLIFAVIGFFAQLVDGAVGMAFGIIASSSLIFLGAGPAVASASVHAAEVVTTGVSGISHIFNRNVARRIFLPLALAGAAGGVIGAYFLSELPEEIIKPFVTLYLFCMALLILARVFGYLHGKTKVPPAALGAGGGFLDAVGGGGWGPLVASSLVASGDQPRISIGSVIVAEFFVTIAVSVTFWVELDISRYAKMAAGLAVGGALAAPLAGYIVRVLPVRWTMILVGIVVSCLTAVNLFQAFR